MAQREPYVISLQHDAWRIVRPDHLGPLAPLESSALAQQATIIQQALQEAGCLGAPVALALGSEWCLATTVDVPSPQMLRKPQVMRYHLEEWIPWSAEDYVVDCVAHRGQALAIVVEHARLSPLLSALDELEIGPAVVAPLALLAVEEHLATAEVPPDHLLLWRSGDALDLIVLGEGRPLVWQSSQGGDGWQQIAAALLAHGPLPVFARGLLDKEIAQLERLGIAAELLTELDPAEAAALVAERLARGEIEPPVNLRRDELAGKSPLDALGRETMRLKAAALFLAMAVAASGVLAGQRYEQAAATAREQLTQLYATTFPEEPETDRPLQALRTAHQLLAGAKDPARSLPVVVDADRVLEQVLAQLPTDLRYRLSEISVEGPAVYLTSEVRSNSDADAIAAALRSGGFEVEPPRTQRLSERGFGAGFTARLESQEATKK